MKGNLIQTDQQELPTSVFRSNWTVKGLECNLGGKPWTEAICPPNKRLLNCPEIRHYGSSSWRSNRAPVCTAATLQLFSGYKKHFSAPACIFFFPLPGLPPNRRDIEFTFNKVLVHKCQLGLALTNTYLLTFQDRSRTSPNKFWDEAESFPQTRPTTRHPRLWSLCSLNHSWGGACD